MKDNNSKYFMLIILLFIPQYTFSQNYTNNWFFGNNAGLNFSTGGPTSINSGMTFTQEGTAVISDLNGSLLFYTDGITVWDKNHIPMPNGDSLSGHHSSTQTALILPGINLNEYFIFTLQSYYDSLGKFCYSIVDMNLNGGNGDVTVKNVLINTQITEKLTGVKNASNTGIWLLTHERHNNTFLAYLFSSNILSLPIISSIGKTFSLYDDMGQMKFSTNGSKIALAAYDSNFVELFDFDNSTGVVSGNCLLEIPPFSGVYGVEFSPNGNYLYASTISGASIYQWDLNSSICPNINSSIQQIANLNNIAHGSLQLAPDSKIYVANPNTFNLGCINNPDQAGILTNFSDTSLSLGNNRCRLGLPNFIQSSILSTGLIENYEKELLNFYPNPFFNKISIKLNETELNNTTISVTNMVGINLLNLNKIENENITIDLSKFESGNYIIRIYSPRSTKIIKAIKLNE